MMKLVIGDRNYSSWSLRPWLVLKQCGLPFEETTIRLREPGTKAEILKHSPSGKVPCLIDGDVVIWDSLAICEYLAEKFPTLWPASSKVRAEARSVCAEMHSGFSALRHSMPMEIHASKPFDGRSAEVAADIARIVGIWENCRKRFAQNGPFLFGHFTNADWRTGRGMVLERFLDHDHLFTSSAARQRWEASARKNIGHELTRLAVGVSTGL